MLKYYIIKQFGVLFVVYPIIIVGGGFSGLVLANGLTDNNIDFLLLERNDRVGKKLLATGNGRGNVTNKNIALENYHGADFSFPSFALKTYDNRHIEGFFDKKGIILTCEEGKVYPASLQANSLLDGLRLYIDEAKIKTNAYVSDITFDKAKKLFTVKTKDDIYYSRAVALCVGGMAGKAFGTDGSSYRLAEKFGHKVSKLYPALVQLVTEKGSLKGLKGVKQTVKATLTVGGKVIKTAVGDLLFTDNGLSGNTIFTLSSFSAGKTDCTINVEFVPQIDVEQIIKSLKNRRDSYPDLLGETLLSGLVHSRISSKICQEAGVAKLIYSKISDKQIEMLAKTLKNTCFKVVDTTGFDNAQVTNGGVLTKDVNPETMESKLVSGLYLCGEVLDVAGDCGGYNLQWAYSSANCVLGAIINGNR